MKICYGVFFFLFLALFSIKGCDNEPDPNEPISFNDEVFLAAILDAGIDSNGDGKISHSEAKGITEISSSIEGRLSDLSGIEYFTDLKTLACGMNDIEKIDLSKNLKLEYLNLSHNKLSELDVSKNVNLEVLYCHYNSIESLELPKSQSLRIVGCNVNQIKSLDVSNTPMLGILACGWNNISDLDVSNLTILQYFNCSANELSHIDVSRNNLLENLTIEENEIRSLNITESLLLKVLICSSNPITSLDISNNRQLQLIHLRNMSELKDVCVWTLPFPPAGMSLYSNGSPGLHLNMDCLE